MFIFDHLGKTKKTDQQAHPQVYASKDDTNSLKIQGYLVRKNGIDCCRGEKRGTLFPSPIF